MAVAAPRARPAAEVPPRPRAAAAPRARARPRAHARPRLGRPLIWILAVRALLAGIVALNVAALQLRMEGGRLQSEIVEVRAQNARIESQISSAASVARIQGSVARLGLVEPVDTTYVEVLAPRR